MPIRQPHHLLDRFGVSLSAVCLLHCLALPVVAAALPFGTAAAADDHALHLLMLALALPLGLAAIWIGFRRHRSAAPAVLGLAGLALMAAGVLLHDDPGTATLFTVAGVAVLAAAHVGNRRAARQAAIALHSPR